MTSACGDTIVNIPNQPSNITQTNQTNLSRIDFRVNGNAAQVKLRFSNPIDGLTQVVTTLPYFISLDTDRSAIFLSLEVTPILFTTGANYPFLSAQIFVNGTLFREATSSDYNTTITASGNWRK